MNNNRVVFCTVENDECKSMELIMNKLSCSRQAMNNFSFPEDTSAEVKTAFYKAAIDNVAEAQFLEKLWWKEIFKKYGIKDNNEVYVDFDTNELYSLNK